MAPPPRPCFVSALAAPPHPLLRRALSTPLPSARLPRPRPALRAAPRPRMSLPPPSAPLLQLCDISSVNQGSLAATAFVFFLTFWGGISFVKGSAKPRVTQAAFTLREPAPALAKSVAAYLVRRSFAPDLAADARPGVATFTGQVRASTSVASILVAVAASALWSATYILNFVLPEEWQSPYWSALTLLAFAVVPWYWNTASRTEEVKLMVEEEEDTGISKLYVKGHRDEIEAMERSFRWKRDEPVYEGDEPQTPPASTAPAEPEKTNVQ